MINAIPTEGSEDARSTVAKLVSKGLLGFLFGDCFDLWQMWLFLCAVSSMFCILTEVALQLVVTYMIAKRPA